MTESGLCSIVYLQKPLPSDSGIALYARDFADVLRQVAEVHLVPGPRTARQSQQLRATVGTVTRAAIALWHRPSALLWVDLAGRGLAEFYTSLVAIAVLRRRVCVVLHDAPEVVGPSLLFSCFDRRGTRRIAMRLSRSLGRTLNCYILQRASTFALSETGARAVGGKYPHVPRPRVLPFVVPQLHVESKPKCCRVFVPGYVADPATLLGLVAALGERWADREVRLALGSLDTEVEAQLRERVEQLGLRDTVMFLGQLPAHSFLHEFELAHIVVRTTGRELRANSAAVSAPALYALAGGCALVTDDERGVREYLVDGESVLWASTPSGVVERVERLLVDHRMRTGLARRGKLLAGELAPRAVGEVLRAHLSRLGFLRPEDTAR